MTAGQLAGLVVLMSPAWMPATLLRVHGVPLGVRALFAGGILAWVAAAVVLAVAWPAALGPLAAVVLAGWAWRVWRARPAAGRRRGWPPGSLGLRSSLRALADYRFYQREAERHGPVFKSSQYDRPVLCVVGMDRCRRFLRENHDRLSSAPLPITRSVAGGILRYMEPGDHARYRRLLQSCMKPRVLAACEARIEEGAAGIVTELAEASRNGAGARPFATVDRLVLVALTRLFFGFAEDDPDIEELRRLYVAVDHRRLWLRGRRTRDAMRAIAARVRERARRYRTSAPGPAGSFLEEAVRQDPGLPDDPVFVENLAYLLNIARLDLAGLCGWLLKILSDHPDQARRIATARRGEEQDAVADRFVAETLRLRQSEFLYRTTAEPIRFEGFSIPPGWLVRLCIRESHASPDAFPRPLEFDPDRFLDPDFPAGQYEPFGIHDHACLGVAVTRTIGRIVVEQLAGYVIEATRDGPMELGLNHHRHWRPSHRLRVRLLPRQPEDGALEADTGTGPALAKVPADPS